MPTKYHPRQIAGKIARALQTFPVVVLAGARQTGKSTLLKRDAIVKDRSYFTTDDPQIMLSLQASAETFFESQTFMTLDEAQRVPEMFLDLKRIVDKERKHGRFLISGSAQFLLLRNLGDSLAGRAGYVRLLPVSIHELLGTQDQPAIYRCFEQQDLADVFGNRKSPSWEESWLTRGGYPEPAWDKSIDMKLWFEAYEATYLERDLRDLAAHIDPLAYQRFLRIAASRNGSLLNQSSIAQAAGLTNITCGRYIHLLETSGLVSRIGSFQDNIGKRWVKSPKLFFTDTSLAAHLAGIPQALEDEKHPAYGHCVESLVLQNLLALAECYPKASMKVYHLRDASGFEIDAIVECGKRQIGIEVKSSRTIAKEDGRNLLKYMEMNSNCRLGIIAYRGSQVLPFGKNVWAVPIGLLLS